MLTATEGGCQPKNSLKCRFLTIRKHHNGDDQRQQPAEFETKDDQSNDYIEDRW